MRETTFEMAQPSDADVVGMLVSEFSSEMLVQLSQERQGALAKEVIASIDDPGSRVLLARIGGSPIGMARATLRSEHNRLHLSGIDKYGYIDAMYVRPGKRERGVGRELLSHLEQWLLSEGVDMVILHAERRRLTFYHAAGYADHHERFKRLSA